MFHSGNWILTANGLFSRYPGEYVIAIVAWWRVLEPSFPERCSGLVCSVPSERGGGGGGVPRAVLWAGIRCPVGTRGRAVLRRLLGDGVPVAGTERGGGWWFAKWEGGAVGGAVLLGLGICWCWGPGVGPWCRPTLGWGTQSRWDLGFVGGGGPRVGPRCRPTLGWGAQSRWDWGRAMLAWWIVVSSGRDGHVTGGVTGRMPVDPG
jgi:hypothetical protein